MRIVPHCRSLDSRIVEKNDALGAAPKFSAAVLRPNVRYPAATEGYASEARLLLCWATRVASQVLAAVAIGTMPRATALSDYQCRRDGEMRHADCEACGGGAERAGPDEARRGARPRR